MPKSFETHTVQTFSEKMFVRFKRTRLPSHQNSGRYYVYINSVNAKINKNLNSKADWDAPHSRKTFSFLDQVIEEEEDVFHKDPISEKASRDHFVKCRITRNRKGIRGKVLFL